MSIDKIFKLGYDSQAISNWVGNFYINQDSNIRGKIC